VAACKVTELFRIPAVVAGDPDADNTGPLTGEPATLLVYNPLAAPVYFRFGTGTPTATAHDLACPGEAIMAWPIDGGTGNITAVLVYPGAVPAADVGQELVVRSTEASLGAFVGPLNGV
jgi:hypothetical protein